MSPDTTVIVERHIPHRAEKVWRALTTPQLVAEWLMSNDIAPTVGHRFNFRAPVGPGWNGVTDCEVLEADPPRRLSYSWNSSGEEAANGLRTTVTFTLEDREGGILLRLEHKGFTESQARNRNGAAFGWNRNLGVLAELVDRMEETVA